ncbi:MAG: ATPase [Dysgonamonadaceae bacterium]|jgi:AAA+ ATPase superfamily predicted ATPase|nr:ATPase [Dysgonamonadaceae bacterium]
MRNPFIISGYISSDYFCDREKESAEFIRKVTNGNNLVLISPRRMGKTRLIEHCFQQNKIQKHFYTFYIDIYATNNLSEFVFKLGKEIFERLKPKGKKFVEQFFSIITSLRPAFKLDEISGTPVFDIGIGDIRSPEFTLEEIFKYIDFANKPCIVAIDEFQQIAKYPEKNVEAIIRTYVQHCKNATFVFAGSQRHILQNIFFSSSRPFYQSAALLTLDVIDEKAYTEFASRLFTLGKKRISKELIKKAYQLFEGHTWYVQAIYNELFSLLNEDEECTEEQFFEAINSRIFSYENLFANTLNLLPERQRELLFAIAKEGKAKGITSGAFIKKHGLHSSGSVQTSATQLLDKEIITQENNIYSVYDRFFGLWLSKVF